VGSVPAANWVRRVIHAFFVQRISSSQTAAIRQSRPLISSQVEAKKMKGPKYEGRQIIHGVLLSVLNGGNYGVLDAPSDRYHRKRNLGTAMLGLVSP
jgi:hypothetical protein